MISEWTYMFSERTCLFRMVVPALTEWMCLFRDNPFRPNGLSIRWMDVLVRKGCTHFNRTICLFRRVAPITTEKFPPIPI